MMPNSCPVESLRLRNNLTRKYFIITKLLRHQASWIRLQIKPDLILLERRFLPYSRTPYGSLRVPTGNLALFVL
jgi:hypothetical protein